MPTSAHPLRLAAIAVVVAGGLAVASCGGGSNSPANAPTPAVAALAAQAVPVKGGSLTLGTAANGQTATLGIGTGAPSGVTVTSSATTTALGSAPAPSAIKRNAQSLAGAVPFLYVTFSVSAALPVSLLTSASVSLASADPAGAAYFVEFDDITAAPGTKLGSAGPGTVAAGIATILTAGGSSSTSPTLIPGHSYLMQFYYISNYVGPTASPSIAPTAGPMATATATALATASASPTAVPTGATPTPLPSYSFLGTSDSTGTCSPSVMCAALTMGTLGVQFTTNPSVSTNVTATVAGGTSQITPNNGSFPVYTGSGTVQTYVQVSTTVAATFTETPVITISSVVGGMGCAFYGYETMSTGNAWVQVSPASGSAALSAGSAVMPAVALTSGVTITPAPFYGAVVCQ